MAATRPTGTTTLQKSDIDNILINDSAASSALAAISESVVNADYTTRKEAVEVAKGLEELERTWTEFIEEQISNIDDLNNTIIRDSGINEVVSSACGEILNNSYELKVEKTIVLSEDKTLLEIALENYPEQFKENPDETLLYLRNTNNIEDEDFFLLQRGSEVKIYV